MLSAGDGVLAEGIPEDWTVAAEIPVGKGAVEEATFSRGDRDEEYCGALGDVPAGNAVALPFGRDEGVAEGWLETGDEGATLHFPKPFWHVLALQ